MTTELILKRKPLTLIDLEGILKLGHIDGDALVLERSMKGYKLKTPVSVPLERILVAGQKGLVEYIVTSLISQRPRLIPWVLENQSLIALAHHLFRSKSKSLMGFYVYTNTVHQYSSWLNFTPDQIIADVKYDDPKEYAARVKKHCKFLQDCLDELDDDGRSPGRLHAYAKHIRTFYRVNEVEIPRPELPRPTVVRKDRAPKPEELERLLEVGDLREKAIISMLALGGFREGTMVRLQYRHVKEDLEKGLTLIHVHVEPEITKGKYHDYDTFLGAESAEALKLYLNARRKGLIDRRIPREEIMDESPLLRDHQTKEVRPIGEKQLYKLIHRLYSRLGLLKAGQNGGYDLRVHSLRKFFKTQLMALGVQSDYVDYMMGHTVDTYHDIQSNGVEFLRNIYARADLRIKPKPSISKNEVVIQAIRGMLTTRQLQRVEEALAEPDTKYLEPEERQREEVRVLSRALRDSLKRELLSGT